MYKRKISIICALVTVLSLTFTMAQASVASSAKITSPRHKITNIYELGKINKIIGLPSEAQTGNQTNQVTIASADSFEPNNTADQATVISGSSTTANINTATDIDLFKKYFTSTKAAVALKNIPSGCDYDLYICDELGYIMAYSENTDNTNEILAYNLPQPGNYIIAVVPYSGYSDSYYYLQFIDNRIISGGHAFASFGTPALWVSTPGQTSDTKSYDLSNDSTIPDGAYVTSVSVGGNLNYSNSWYKEISNGDGSWYQTSINGYTISSFDEGTMLKRVWYARFCPLSISGGSASWIPEINFYYSYDPYINYLVN